MPRSAINIIPIIQYSFSLLRTLSNIKTGVFRDIQDIRFLHNRYND